MKAIHGTLVLLFLAACGSSPLPQANPANVPKPCTVHVTPIKTPVGLAGAVIEWCKEADYWRLAGEACPFGYNVLSNLANPWVVIQCNLNPEKK